MSKIVGNVVGIPNPQSDFNQNDPAKADYIKNKPTTLSGYGITDAYTKDEVDAKIGSGGGGGSSINTNNPEFTGTVKIGEATLYMDEYGGFNIEKPDTENVIGVLNIGGCLSIDNGELLFNGMPVGAGGDIDIKDLTTDLTYNPLTEEEKNNVIRNTGLDETIGDIEGSVDELGASVGELEASVGDIDTALDEIIELQEAHISGDIGDLPLWQGGSY